MPGLCRLHRPPSVGERFPTGACRRRHPTGGSATARRRRRAGPSTGASSGLVDPPFHEVGTVYPLNDAQDTRRGHQVVARPIPIRTAAAARSSIRLSAWRPRPIPARIAVVDAAATTAIAAISSAMPMENPATTPITSRPAAPSRLPATSAPSRPANPRDTSTDHSMMAAASRLGPDPTCYGSRRRTQRSATS